MALPPSYSTPLRAKLTNVYHQLDVERQQVLQVFAIAYIPLARTKATAIVKRVAQETDFPAFSHSQLKGHIDALASASVLRSGAGGALQCHPLVVETVTKDAVAQGTFEAIASAIDVLQPISRPNGPFAPRHFISADHLLREFRLGLYRNRFDIIEDVLDEYYNHSYFSHVEKLTVQDIVLRVINNPFDAEQMSTLPFQWHDDGIATILTQSELYLFSSEPAYQYVLGLWSQSVATHADSPSDTTGDNQAAKKEEAIHSTTIDNAAAGLLRNPTHCSSYLRLVLVQHLLWRGEFEQARQVLESVPNSGQDSAAIFWGWLSFLEGNIEEAIAHYTLALKSYRKAKRKKKAYFNTVGGIFFIFALLKEGSGAALNQAQTLTEFMTKQSGHWLQQPYITLNHLVRLQQGDPSQKRYIVAHSQTYIPSSKRTSVERLVDALCFYWVDRESAVKSLGKHLESIYTNAQTSGFTWLAMELATLLSRSDGGRSYRADVGGYFSAQAQLTPLADLIRPLEAWELSLKALTNLTKEASAATNTERRMAWMVTMYGPHSWMLQPREQKITKSGKWGKGRNIALKRLHENRNQFDYLTPHDEKVLAYLDAYRGYDYYYGGTEYSFDALALVALIGHPLVFWQESPTVRLDVVKGEPELLVQDKGDGSLDIRFSLQSVSREEPISLIKESPTRLKVIEITDDYRQIAAILGSKNSLTVPLSAKEQVLGAINSISTMVTVHSDIGGGMESVEEVPADAMPHVHLLPSGEGLNVALLCRPFAEAGPYYSPGTGGKNVIAEIEGQRLQTNRNLQQEQDLAHAVVEQCATLARYDADTTEWLLDDPEECLELLVDLHDLGDVAVVEWPEGETLKISQHAGFSNFHMSIRQHQDWFSASGELRLDDDQVLGMRQLMALLDQTTGRFVPLGDGQFIALTNEFRKRLDEMRSFADQHGDGLRFHPLAALAMDDMMEDIEHLTTDRHWQSNIKKIKEMETLQPELPSTLQAELRDYQQEGFEWMARLAHWGVGACLADDMGLGKTLQALSVILMRAPQGPTLIIAPTSVGMNWISEAQTFAPTLNPLQFGGGDRQTLLDSLQPFDMLVCTYGLLQQDDVAAMLADVEWETIVLDEAQAIKNAATKRSKAAMKLQGKFKVLTTGTPIENHLGELWNLFRFINPGLLGSMDRFNQKFAYPIERENDKPARQRLKKLISPFILRRTKSQVLNELPSRTEITLQVELSKEETAMYEALRREAVDRLSETKVEAGTKHLQVLAEIMKLRRMCCNPKLIMPETNLMGSKLELFGETLEELLQNRHKALVFSQFVDHLKIIRDYLEANNIHYQYLDGSTPAKARKQRVDAFQAGDGDVFLISLKAGGTGLNLTAADYVIHMDPWWNPAVEDQASDRAHRIGQKRPVTIYRLVAQNTIEEKIVALHNQKRDLADSLLEGTDMSGKISTDDLIKLMSEG